MNTKRKQHVGVKLRACVHINLHIKMFTARKVDDLPDVYMIDFRVTVALYEET